jgi:hypothetical protein
MRVKVEFLDESNNPITDTDRLEKIQQTLYYDKLFGDMSATQAGYKGSADLMLYKDGPHHPDDRYHKLYTEAYLAALPATQFSNWFNTFEFELDPVRNVAGTGVYYLNYYNNATGVDGQQVPRKDVLTTSTLPVKVFTSVVFPSDWNQNDLIELGNYSIRLTVEVIQAQGFGSRAEAFDALDKETILYNYGAVGAH